MAPSLHAPFTFLIAYRALVLFSTLTLSGALSACSTSQSPSSLPPPNQPTDQPTPPQPLEVPTTVVPPSQDTTTQPPTATAQSALKPTPPTDDLRLEVLPGIWVNRTQRTLDFEGTVAIDAHNPKTPIIYLEWVVCAPDTKEHESLIVTKLKPSHLHAALLLLGVESGSPGAWKWEGTTLSSIAPRGGPLQILVQPLTPNLLPDPASTPAPITDWIVGKPKAQDQPKTLSEHWPTDTFLFAGSTLIDDPKGLSPYKADLEGGHIGLTTFGHEVIVWSRMFNPDSGVESPYWIANASKVPPFGTPVRVYISPLPPQ